MWMGELGSWWVLGVCAHLWIAFGSAMCGFLQSPSGQISHGWNCSHANTKFALCSNFSLVCQLHWNKFVFSNRHYSTTDFTSQFLEDSLFPLLWSTCLGECEDGSFMHTYFPISYKILDNIKKHKVMSKVPLQCHETDVNFLGHIKISISQMALLRWHILAPSPSHHYLWAKLSGAESLMTGCCSFSPWWFSFSDGPERSLLM